MSINYSAKTLAVLEALGKDAGKRMHTRRVAEEAGVSTGEASIVLRALERSNLLLVEDVGNMRFYRINLANPIARQWQILFNIIRLKPLTEDLAQITDQVVLFGSAAEGTDTGKSDIDLFILTQHERMVKEALRRFEKSSDRHLSPIIMNAQYYARLRRQDRALCENISRGKVLWEKE